MKRGRVSIAVLAFLLTACSSSLGSADGSEQLTVLAASSLTEAFTRIASAFEAAHEGAAVRFGFGPSDGLARQIQAGGPVDVFASASPTWMDAVQKDPGVSHRVDFAKNHLVLITPSDDPARVRSIDDLANPGVQLVLAARGVPAGDYAREILDTAGIASRALSNVVSNEQDVKGVVQKVLLGEADAGIVYVTDVTPEVEPKIREIAIPKDLNVTATYPIAVVAGSEHPSLAADFVSYVSGAYGQQTLASYGFLPPS